MNKERRREYQHEYYLTHKEAYRTRYKARMADPEKREKARECSRRYFEKLKADPAKHAAFLAKRRERARRRAQEYPEKYEAVKARHKAYYKAWKADPAKREEHRAKRRTYYAAHKDEFALRQLKSLARKLGTKAVMQILGDMA